ncbi:MAG: autotransporter assembly complex protein TamB, partial [Aeromonas sp.]
MIWLKRSFFWLMGLLFLLLIGISLLCFTHQGNKWMWQQAKLAVPALKGELVAGQLGYGWTFEGAGWHDQYLDITVKRAVLDWDLGKLLQGKLWVKSLVLTRPQVKIAKSEPTPATPSEPFVWRPLPLFIEIDSLKVADLSLALPGVAVTLGALDIGATFNRDGLTVRGPALDKLNVTLTSARQKAGAQGALNANPNKGMKAASPAKKAGQAAPIALPAIHLPFPIHIEQASARQVRYQQDERVQQIDTLSLSVTAIDDRVELRELSLRHPMAELALHGHIQLIDDYPLALTLNAKARKGLLGGELQGQLAALALTGSLGKLGLALTTKGPIAAKLKGSLAPLDPALPFTLALNWDRLSWPLSGARAHTLRANTPRAPKSGATSADKASTSANQSANKAASDEPSYQLGKGTLTAKGQLSGYQFSLHTLGKGTLGKDSLLPPFKLALDGRGDLNELSKIALLLHVLNGEVTLDGKLAWHNGIAWQGRTQFKGIDPAQLAPKLNGLLAGELDSAFTMNKAGHWVLTLPKFNVNGTLNHYPLALNAAISGNNSSNNSSNDSRNDQLEWQIPTLSLRSGPNQLEAKGSITKEKWQLDANVHAPGLGSLYPGLKGDIKGQLKVSGNQQTPQVQADLVANRIGYQGSDLQGIRLKGHAVLGAAPTGDLQLAVAQFNQGAAKLRDIALTLAGDMGRHQLTLSMQGSPLAANLKLNGAMQGDHWRGSLSELQLTPPRWRWDLLAPWALDVDIPKQQLTMGDLCLGSKGASVCVKRSQITAAQGTLAFAVNGFDLKRLRPWLPDNFRWQGGLSADGQASWQQNKPTLHAMVRTTPGTFVADGIKADYQQLALGLDFDHQKASIGLNFSSTQIGNIDTRLLITDPTGRGNLGGQLKFDNLKLATFAALIPEVRSLQGVISADARFDGTLKAPLLFGQLNLRDGEVQTHSDMVTLTKLVTRLKIEGNRAELDGSMLVGKGPLVLGGQISWANLPVSGRLTIQGKDLEAQYPGMGRIKVSPDIAVSLGEQAQITGQIDIPWARILVKSLPDSAVAVSSDVTVIYNDVPPPPKPASLPLAMEVAIRLGDDVKIDAMGLKTNVAGGITLQQAPEKPLAGRGQLVLVNGRFKAYGQNLLIKEGKIIFSGPLDRPYLNIEANRDPDTIDGQVTVGVRVTGPASKPVIAVYSEPQMAQSEQLSYLLRGKGLQTSGGEDGGFNGLLVAGAVSQANGVVSSIGESLGMNDVTLDTAGSGDNTQVVLSAYLLPGLQFQYGVGVFSPIAEFKLRYELLPRL